MDRQNYCPGEASNTYLNAFRCVHLSACREIFFGNHQSSELEDGLKLPQGLYWLFSIDLKALNKKDERYQQQTLLNFENVITRTVFKNV